MRRSSGSPPSLGSCTADRERYGPKFLLDRGLDLDVARICVLYFGPRVVELVLRSDQIMRGQRALRIEEDSTPLLRHLPKLLQQPSPLCDAKRVTRRDNFVESSAISDIGRVLGFYSVKDI